MNDFKDFFGKNYDLMGFGSISCAVHPLEPKDECYLGQCTNGCSAGCSSCKPAGTKDGGGS